MAARATTDTNSLRLDYRLLGVLVTLIVVLAGGWLNARASQSKADERIALLEAYKIDHAREKERDLQALNARLATLEKTQGDNFNAVMAGQAKLQETLFTVQLAQAKH